MLQHFSLIQVLRSVLLPDSVLGDRMSSTTSRVWAAVAHKHYISGTSHTTFTVSFTPHPPACC